MFCGTVSGSEIRAEILLGQEVGWEPAEQISAAALKLQHREYIDHNISMIDVVLWVATLGLALLVTLLLGDVTRRYVIFEPVEFRVLMRRPAAHPEAGSPSRSHRLSTRRLSKNRDLAMVQASTPL